MNYDESLARLNTLAAEDLYEWVYESHKDFYGVKGRHMFGASKEALIEWITAHFVWDNDSQCWNNAVPFVED